MAITKPAQKKPAAADKFIASAPDAAPQQQPKHVKKGNKIQISLTITEPLLARVDELAERLGQSRAAVINLALYQSLETGLRIGSERPAP